MDTALALTPEISIIIPVYNVEDSITKCLDSVFTQNVPFNIEVIAIDDGSIDKSLELLYLYQKKRPELIVIQHKENQKLSRARNSGINKATGKYVLHVDSDDWLLPGALHRLYEVSSKNNPEVIVFNYKHYIQDKPQLVNAIQFEGFSTNREDLIRLFFGACWTKMVKRELLVDLIYGTEGINSEEDLVYGTEIFLKANSIYLLPDHLYAYLSNLQSITGSISSEKFLKGKGIVLNELTQILQKYNAPQWIIKRVLDYFDKFLYIEVAKLHFWTPLRLLETRGLLLDDFNKINLYKPRLNILKRALDNKFISLNEARNRAGARLAIGILVRSFTTK